MHVIKRDGRKEAAFRNSALQGAYLILAARAVGLDCGPMSGFDADAVKRMVPMQRVGQPAEVAHLVGFLASDQAGYISGQVISINGAMI